MYNSTNHTVTWTETSSSYVTVTVIYYSGANNSNVTNNVSFTGNGLNNPSDVHTGSTSVTNRLKEPSSNFDGAMFKSGASKLIAGSQLGDVWNITMYNHSSVDVTGTITDVIPCADDTSATLYVSATSVTAPCTTPAVDVQNIVFSTSFRPYDEGVTTTFTHIGTITWHTNTGNSGTGYVPMSIYPQDGMGQGGITTAQLGIPAGQKLTALEIEYGMESATDGFMNGAITVMMQGVTDVSLKQGDIVRNRASYTMINTTNGAQTTWGDDTHDFVIDNVIQPKISTNISDTAGSGVVYRPTQQITWRAEYYNQVNWNDPGKPVRPDWYIAIPNGLRYVYDSVEFINLPAGVGEPDLIESYPGTGNLQGYSILHMRWPVGTQMPAPGAIRANFKTMVEPSVPQGSYTGAPPQFGVASTTDPRSIYSAGYAIGDNIQPVYPNGDQYDFNSNGNITEQAATANAGWRVSLAATAFGDVRVKGSEDPTYEFYGATVAGGSGAYQMKLQNASNDGSRLTNFVYYATLPQPGDTYVSQGFAGVQRGSDTTVSITSPVAAPSNVTVMYSTSQNPCRNEVYPNSANTGCSNNWVPASSITDWSTVRSLKLIVNGTYEGGQGETVTVPIKMADDAKNGDIAWMSIAYQATNADTGITLLPAEAPRVGLEVDGPALETKKTANPASGTTVQPGSVVTYTVATQNLDNVALTATVTDNLAAVLNHADIVPGSLHATSSFPGNTPAAPTLSGTTLTWQGPMAANEVITLTYQVKLHGNAFSQTINNHVITTGRDSSNNPVETTCVTGQEPQCQTNHNTPAAPAATYQVNKSSNPVSGSTVQPGSTVQYTVTVTNTGEVPLNVNLADNLAPVLAHTALVNGSLAASSSVSGKTQPAPTVTGQTLNWSGNVAVGEVVTLRYNVTVNSNAFSVSFRNAVTSTATATIGGATVNVPSNCVVGTEANCFTTHNTPAAPVPSYQVAKTSSPASGSTVAPGSTIHYTVTVTNTGQVPIDATLQDNLAPVLAHTALVNGSLAASSSVSGKTQPAPTRSGTTLNWGGNIAVGEVVILSYDVTVNSDASSVSFRNAITSTGTASVGGNTVNVPSNCTTGNETGCFTTHNVPSRSTGYVVNKTSNPVSGSTVSPNSTIKYTITITNTGDAPLTKVDLTDNLAPVLAHTTFVSGSPAATSSMPGKVQPVPTLSGTTLSWSGNLLVGEVATLTYDVKVNSNAELVSFKNAVTSTGEAVINGTPTNIPSNCVAGTEPGCFTEHNVPARPAVGYVVNKSSNPISGSMVNPNSTVQYTVTVNNTGQVPVNVTLADNLTPVLAYTTLVNNSLAASSSVSGKTQPAPTVSGTALGWNGTVAVGEVVTLTYNVVVNRDAYSVNFHNAVTSTGEATVNGDPVDVPSNCVAGTEAGCFTEHNTPPRPVTSYTVDKSSDPASGSTVTPGSTVKYTVVVTNTGAVPVNVDLTDNLAPVLAHTKLDTNSLSASSSVSGSTPADPVAANETLTWSGVLGLNEVVTLEYSVTVNEDAMGISFRNAVTSTGKVTVFGEEEDLASNCTTGTEAGCFTEHNTPVKPAPVAPDTGVGSTSFWSAIVSSGMLVALLLTAVLWRRKAARA